MATTPRTSLGAIPGRIAIGPAGGPTRSAIERSFLQQLSFKDFKCDARGYGPL